MILSGKVTMEFLGSYFSRFLGLFYGEVSAKAGHFPILGNISIPFFTLLAPRYSLNAGCIINPNPSIAHILTLSGNPEIDNSIISVDAVDMVDTPVRETSMEHGPCNPMGGIINIMYVNIQMAVMILTACYFPGKTSIPSFVNSLQPGPKRALKPYKFPSLWPIFQNGFKIFNGQHHAVT